MMMTKHAFRSIVLMLLTGWLMWYFHVDLITDSTAYGLIGYQLTMSVEAIYLMIAHWQSLGVYSDFYLGLWLDYLFMFSYLYFGLVANAYLIGHKHEPFDLTSGSRQLKQAAVILLMIFSFDVIENMFSIIWQHAQFDWINYVKTCFAYLKWSAALLLVVFHIRLKLIK